MQTHSSNLQLALIDSVITATETDLQEKAWHILALLLSIGHPAPPVDLACRCTLFNPTPDLIESLCSIRNSPVTLTLNNQSSGHSFLVTISPLGLLALNQFVSNFNLIDLFLRQIGTLICQRRVPLEDIVRIYCRKRKRIAFNPGDVYEDDQPMPKRIQNGRNKVYKHLSEDVSSSIEVEANYKPIQLNDLALATDFFVKTILSQSSCQLRDNLHIEDETNMSAIVEWKEDNRIMAWELDEESILPIRISSNEAVSQETKADEIDLASRIDIKVRCCQDDLKSNSILFLEFMSLNGNCNAMNECFIESESANAKEEPLNHSILVKGHVANLFQSINSAFLDMPQESNCKRMKELSSLGKEAITTCGKNQAEFSTTELYVHQKSENSKPSTKMKVISEVAAAPRQQALCQTLQKRKAAYPPKENQQCKKNHIKITMEQKSRQKCNDIHTKERRKDCAPNCPKDQVGSKDFPCFDSYIIQEEEGSGGYGTVYRATRKNDGAPVAIKYPHENAHRHHVSTELRMLERFGGRNFVIKYEGCLKNQNSECFILEYVEHDRPEVLKKEIDILQLRWYGYCMFRALASLHKQGVVHRDVKPGNFLFSRKANKGYLIDFNLALDLHQKLGTPYKSKAVNDTSFNHSSVSNARCVPPSKNKRFLGTRFMDAIDLGALKGSKSTLEPKNTKKKFVRNINVSQGADGSGVTSVKDATSGRTASAERRREPLPCQGRKELISLLQEAMQSPNLEASSVPMSTRRRIAAPLGKDRRHIYLTPMPLHSNGVAVTGTGLIKNKGDGKSKKEGPCVGTKGFRAPEVLFRSLHQGPKVDIWSAGVTLLYLMLGKMPFYGDPEQNINDIAKLRGSEDLWEVSKLHDREASFPAGLYNMQSLPSMMLWEWCKLNSKREDFLETIPTSFIDLLDKCLIVNPRLRISAEDALKHEFFTPCHEILRKQKQFRLGINLHSQSNNPSHGQSIARSVKISQQT